MSLIVPRARKLPPFDPFLPAFRDDPYPVLARYRAVEPLHWREDQEGQGRWFVFRHEDVCAALVDPALGRECKQGGAALPKAYPAYARMISEWMLFRDSPFHTRVRTIFTKAMNQIGTKRLRPRIEEIAQSQCDQLPDGTLDLIARFAFALPIFVVAELLGVPQADHDRFRHWSQVLASAIDLNPSPAVLEAAEQTSREVCDYLAAIFEERRREPRGDLISALVEQQSRDGDVTEFQLISNCVFLLCAGHETTTNLIATGMLALLRHPVQAERLRRSPDRIPSAVEEILRFESPVQMTTRVVQKPTELAGVRLKEGQCVNLLLGSANRDPEVFPDPDRFDIDRSPNPHTAFGVGPHYCIGALLGRLEGEIALRQLLQRFPRMTLVDRVPAWRGNVAFRGLERLMVDLKN